MTRIIHPCLWFDNNAGAAATFYCSVFEDARITVNTPMVVNFEMFGQKFMGLNGGPIFKINPSISFFVWSDTAEETTTIWEKLCAESKVLMPLGKYPWSEQYGWLQDKFGVNWQLFTGKQTHHSQRISPALMFAGKMSGNTEPAIAFYCSIFKDSGTFLLAKYEAGERDKEGLVKHAQFHLGKYALVAMDSSMEHEFSFNEALSFVVECDTQEEIDYYWEQLSAGGKESQCGWLKDRYGVSWQIVPTILGKLMTDPTRAPRVMQAFMKMKKFDIAALENA